MCTAELASKAGLGASAAGAAYSTVGSYYAASTERIGLKAQAALADTNARIAEMNAQSEILTGQKNYAANRLKMAAFKSEQKVAFAANGVTLDSPSATDVLTTTDYINEVDSNQIMSNAVREAWGYRTQAVDYQNKALLSRSAAKSISPWFSAGSTLLTGAKSVYGDYKDYMKTYGQKAS